MQTHRDRSFGILSDLRIWNAYLSLFLDYNVFRVRAASNVSKSVSVLDFSGKEKSFKPPRRLSNPLKAAVSPLPRPMAATTPISENRIKLSNGGQGKNATPVSDVSKPASQRKFSVLSSASYWLTQIKLSESAAKHSVSVGFFKLAMEAGCEPLQRLTDELKSYAKRHNLAELGESCKDLLRSYNISEDVAQLQVSETCFQVPEESTRSSDEDVHSSSSTTVAKKLKPKALNSETFQAQKVNTQNKVSANKNKGSAGNNSGNLKSVANPANIQKKAQTPSKKEAHKVNEKIKNQGNKSVGDKDSVDSVPVKEVQQFGKENVDAQQTEESVE
ncbi:hypothetical protein GIB67_033049 [Kingdonia uniflora]|uniref:Uncharacterized protein n=1 Tax=Kingdonia uniflora TaxID=39325 RepID=A0A7J7MYG3_9MAGN|nr:hypothetical protein GIB67_033049 [Kingdonia uniflora]